ADDMDGLVAPDLARHFPDHVEQTRIHMDVFLLAPVAQEPVEPLERLLVIAAVTPVRDRDVFFGVNVMERESAGVAIGDCGFESVVAEQYYQGNKPRTRADPRGKNRSQKSTCRACRHSRSHIVTHPQLHRPPAPANVPPSTMTAVERN